MDRGRDRSNGQEVAEGEEDDGPQLSQDLGLPQDPVDVVFEETLYDDSDDESEEYAEEDGNDADAHDDDDDDLEPDAVSEDEMIKPIKARRGKAKQKAAGSQSRPRKQGTDLEGFGSGKERKDAENATPSLAQSQTGHSSSTQRKGHHMPDSNNGQSSAKGRQATSETKATAHSRSKGKGKQKATSDDEAPSSSEEDARSRTGSIPTKYLDMITDFAQQIDDFAAKMAPLTGRPTSKILRMLFKEDVVHQRAKSSWAAYSAWYAKLHPLDTKNGRVIRHRQIATVC